MSRISRPAAFARPTLFVLTLLIAFVLAGFSARQANATIYYVATPSVGTGSGSSWANAGPLQPIITGAHSGDQVWVKKGIYVGNFTATDGVAVYGGFAGTETSLTQRNPGRNVTYLDANNSGTAYAIPSAATGTNTLDGFTIENAPNRGLYDPATDHLVVANDTFTGDSINNNGNGGAVDTQAVTASFTTCTFTGNTVAGSQSGVNVYGGAVYTSASTTATFTSCYFTDNSVSQTYYGSGYGGGIACAGTSTISNCSFTSNRASSAGGGVYAFGNSVTINNQCTFTSNTNEGVDASCTTNTITDCTFTNNTNRGMGVGGPNTSTISGCAFNGNTNTNYGNGGGLYTGSISSTITNCTFSNNSLTGSQSGVNTYGGGLYAESGTQTTVMGCTFSGNTVTQTYYGSPYGGGFGGFGTPYIIDCTFMNNSPSEIDLENVGTQSNPAYVIDNLIYGTGTSAGNGINLADNGSSTGFAYAIISNNDISNANAAVNIGSGSSTGGTLSVANNIYYENNGAVNDNSTVTFVSSHNDLYGNTYTYQGSGITTDPSDLTHNPAFKTYPNFTSSPVTYGDLHLQATSLLINAGDDDYVSDGDTDRDGNDRIQGSAVDIGCYEAATDSAATVTSLSPSTVQAGDDSFTLTVNGTGFVSGATVDWNGTALTTTYVSATKLTATVAASLVATAGTASVSVVNSGMDPSNSLTLTITAATTITSLSPTSKPAGSATFTLTVHGTAFVSGAVVYWNGAALTTTEVSSTELTATVPASDVAATGAAVVTAANPHTAQTSPLTFMITTPIATLTSLSPSSVQVGSATFTLTLTGTYFVSGATVKWGSTTLTSAYLSATTFVAQVPASLLTTAGTASVTVTNPGVAASNALTFTIAALPAAAHLTSLMPSSAQAGSAGFTLTLTGTGFVPGAVVDWNGTALTSAYLSATTAVAIIPSSLLATAGSASVTIINPSAAASNAVTFTITAIPAPATLTGLSPASAVAGSAGFTLTLTGTGFVSGAVVKWNGTTLMSAYFSATTFAALVPSSLLATAGTASVTVTNPGVAASNAVTFTIKPAPPTITSFTPTSGPVGTVVTITGTNLNGVTAVRFHNANATTFSANAGGTQLTVTVPTGAGTGTITVTTPGGSVTSSGTFTVN